MLRKHFFFLLCCCFCFINKTDAQVIIDSSTKNELNIITQASLSEPIEEDLTIEDVIKNPSQLSFSIIKAKPNISFTAKHYWLNFEIKNTLNKSTSYYLETARPIIDNVECFIIDEKGEIATQISGDSIPFKERAIQHNKVLFRLDFEAQQNYKVYIHYKSDGEVLDLPLILYTPNRLVERTHNELLVYGLFYGVLLLAAITYLFFYFAMADKSFLYYSLYVIFVGLFQFSLDGLFYQYIMPGSGWIYLRSLILVAIAAPFLMSRYVVTYLKIEEYFTYIPRIFKVLNIALGVLFISILLSPKAFELSYPIANLLGLSILLLVIVSIISFWVKYKTIDWLFVTGIFCLVVGFVIFILNNLGILPNSIITEYSTKLGTGLEVVFLSLSMANRIWQLKSEKEKIQGVALQKSEEANELKTYFMSMMSHELRTPLNAIMGIADVMGKEVEDEKVKDNFNRIKYSSVSLLSSVNDILDFSKIEKGELTLESEEFAPKQVIESVKANWEIQAKNKEVQFEYSISKDIPELLKGDSNRLTQILNNLLSNAVKFTQTGTVKFDVEASIANKDLATLKITVQDTGIGIPKEKQDSVFESFIQESIDNKRQYGGFGLGLSIVKKLVELHKGQIALKSEVGKGTTFTVELPYTIIKPAQQKQTTLSEDNFDLKGTKILVVEDNDVNQFIMKTILSRWENTLVTIAENGKIALEKLLADDFDFVLMDLQMPVMDGYEATQEIRKGNAGEKNTRIPIMALTADVTEQSKHKAQSVGMDDYMTKPVDQVLLFEKITLQLSK